MCTLNGLNYGIECKALCHIVLMACVFSSLAFLKEAIFVVLISSFAASSFKLEQFRNPGHSILSNECPHKCMKWTTATLIKGRREHGHFFIADHHHANEHQ